MMVNCTPNFLNCLPSNCVRPCASATSTSRHRVNRRTPLDSLTDRSDATSVPPILFTRDTRKLAQLNLLSQLCLTVRRQSRTAYRVVNLDAVYRKCSRHGPTTSSTCRQLLLSVNCSTPKAADQIRAAPDVQLLLTAINSPQQKPTTKRRKLTIQLQSDSLSLVQSVLQPTPTRLPPMWTGSRPTPTSADILERPHIPMTTEPTQLWPRFIVRYGMSHRRAGAAQVVTSQW